MSSGAESKEALDDAIAQLAELLFVSPQERAEAIRELESIADADFAFRPNVLIALRNAYEDEDEIARATQILDLKYADAIEWRVRNPARRGSASGIRLPRRNQQ